MIIPYIYIHMHIHSIMSVSYVSCSFLALQELLCLISLQKLCLQLNSHSVLWLLGFPVHRTEWLLHFWLGITGLYPLCLPFISALVKVAQHISMDIFQEHSIFRGKNHAFLQMFRWTNPIGRKSRWSGSEKSSLRDFCWIANFEGTGDTGNCHDFLLTLTVFPIQKAPRNGRYVLVNRTIGELEFMVDASIFRWGFKPTLQVNI